MEKSLSYYNTIFSLSKHRRRMLKWCEMLLRVNKNSTLDYLLNGELAT